MAAISTAHMRALYRQQGCRGIIGQGRIFLPTRHFTRVFVLEPIRPRSHLMVGGIRAHEIQHIRRPIAGMRLPIASTCATKIGEAPSIFKEVFDAMDSLHREATLVSVKWKDGLRAEYYYSLAMILAYFIYGLGNNKVSIRFAERLAGW